MKSNSKSIKISVCTCEANCFSEQVKRFICFDFTVAYSVRRACDRFCFWSHICSTKSVSKLSLIESKTEFSRVVPRTSEDERASLEQVEALKISGAEDRTRGRGKGLG